MSSESIIAVTMVAVALLWALFSEEEGGVKLWVVVGVFIVGYCLVHHLDLNAYDPLEGVR